jgi:hypothetical protein
MRDEKIALGKVMRERALRSVMRHATSSTVRQFQPPDTNL